MEHGFTWFGSLIGLHGGWEHIGTGFLVSALLLLFASKVRASFADADQAIMPDDGASPRSISEVFVEFIMGIARSAIPDHPDRYVPLLATFFAYILVANVLGLVPGFSPPTSSFNITFALGCVSFGAYHAYGVKAQGLGAYLKHFLGPVLFIAPLMLVIEMFSHAFRPISLGVRLYANMFADHTVIEIFTGLTKALIPVAFYALGFFVCLVQSFVFTMLSAIYITGAVTHEHGHEEL
jgi:F-type H+-transporting ATPase subunit a